MFSYMLTLAYSASFVVFHVVSAIGKI
jgi:hypothetical protein